MKNMKLALLAVGLMVGSVGIAREKAILDTIITEKKIPVENPKFLDIIIVSCLMTAATMPGSQLHTGAAVVGIVAFRGYVDRIIADATFEANLANDLGYESEIKARKERDAFEKITFDAAQF